MSHAVHLWEPYKHYNLAWKLHHADKVETTYCVKYGFRDVFFTKNGRSRFIVKIPWTSWFVIAKKCQKAKVFVCLKVIMDYKLDQIEALKGRLVTCYHCHDLEDSDNDIVGGM